MTRKVLALGLGPALADPASIWPSTTVIEVVAEVAALLGDRPQDAVRQAIAAQAGVDLEQVEPVTVTRTAHGSALVQIARDSNASRALSVAAQRRATSPAEALHAALLAGR